MKEEWREAGWMQCGISKEWGSQERWERHTRGRSSFVCEEVSFTSVQESSMGVGAGGRNEPSLVCTYE
jgi:hypothetical protein